MVPKVGVRWQPFDETLTDSFLPGERDSVSHHWRNSSPGRSPVAGDARSAKRRTAGIGNPGPHHQQSESSTGRFARVDRRHRLHAEVGAWVDRLTSISGISSALVWSPHHFPMRFWRVKLDGTLLPGESVEA